MRRFVSFTSTRTEILNLRVLAVIIAGTRICRRICDQVVEPVLGTNVSLDNKRFRAVIRYAIVCHIVKDINIEPGIPV